MGLSPLHDHVFSLFLTLRNTFHEFHLDNHYMSAKCVHLSYTHHTIVLKCRGSVELVAG